MDLNTWLGLAVFFLVLVFFLWSVFYKSSDESASFIKAFSAMIPREHYEGRSDANGNVAIKCSYDDFKVDINFILTDTGSGQMGGGCMGGVWISLICPFKTKRTFKVTENKNTMDLSAEAAGFERGCQIEADCDQTKMRIMFNPDLYGQVKKILDLFHEIDLSDEILSAVSNAVDFRCSEPEALFSHLDSFVAFAKALKTDSHFVQSR